MKKLLSLVLLGLVVCMSGAVMGETVVFKRSDQCDLTGVGEETCITGIIVDQQNSDGTILNKKNFLVTTVYNDGAVASKTIEKYSFNDNEKSQMSMSAKIEIDGADTDYCQEKKLTVGDKTVVDDSCTV